MEIKVHKPEGMRNLSDKNQQQKPLRMTLKEYLQSTNLKRRINSRSKSKSKKQSDNDPDNLNYLQLPISQQTIEYFKLNQQWKAKKTFNTWIVTLKQLTRQYISKDNEYLEVIRLIEKIAEFVRTQIQTIKKDNLLLQSFLVTQASYWPAEGSTYDQETNHDKLSNYLKVLANKSSGSQSPNKSQQFIEVHSPQIKHQFESRPFKTSTQPKIRLNHNEISTNHASHNQKSQGSSTVYKKSQERKFSVSQTLEKNIHPDLSKEQYIYSFKDKHLNPQVINSKSSKNHSQQHLGVRPFSYYNDTDQIDEEDENLEISKYQEPGLLRIQSKNQDQVPRLSLISRYDQSKNHQNSFQNPNQTSKTKINNNQTSRVAPTHFSQISTKSQISHPQQTQAFKQTQSRVPLRERKQKVHKTIADEFAMIVLDQRLNLNEKNSFQGQTNDNAKIKEKKYERTLQKHYNPKETSQNKNIQQKYETTPLSLRQSPDIILETPSTLRRRNQTGIQITENKNQEQARVNIQNPLNPTNQGYNRSVRSNSAVYKSSINSYESTRSNSRENIMKRYENFAR